MSDQTEKQKMLANELYIANDPELVAMRTRARRSLRFYNATAQDDLDRRAALLKDLLGSLGDNVWIEPPFYCDYGSHIYLGNNVYFNFNCVLLDCNEIRIGDNTQFGPMVQIYTAYHPIEAAERVKGPELAAPIMIGRNVWVGGGAIICQGITIGDNTTIGAGSVVTKDIPANVFAAGNPCRVIKQL